MLVILTENQILDPYQVCQGCLFANQSGQPRWKGSHLSCGHRVRKPTEHQPEQYECQMGFRVANVE